MGEEALWSQLYGINNMPSWEDISSFIDNPLWQEFNNYLQSAYHIQPQLNYSKCAAQRGWNVKYKKSSRSLTTLYPERGYFIALVVIGSKEEDSVEDLMPLLQPYTRELYQGSCCMAMGRWLMVKIKDKKILEDVKKLITVRVKPESKSAN